jgi:IclR family KDG regulon transcriptional repressor
MLGIPKSSASRLLKAMLQEGLLARHENSPRYKVGNLLFEVSQLYRLNSSLIELTDDVLKAICRETGHTGYLSILDGTDGFRTTRCGPSIPMASVCRRPTRRRASTN